VFVTLLAVALLSHQLSYVAGHGRRHLTRSFAPAWGLRLPPPAFVAVQVGAIPVAIGALAARHPAGNGAALATLALFAAVQTLRLSNHLYLAVLGTAALTLSGAPTTLDARLLLGGVYLTAGLLKCNREFLTSRTSTARYIVAKYLYVLSRDLAGRSRRTPAALLSALPPAVALVEVTVGLALLAGRALPAALLAALLLHVAFGLTGNFPFSLMVLPFWYVAAGGAPEAAPPAGGTGVLAVAVAAGAAVAGYRLGAHWTYPSPRTGRWSFAALSGAFGGLATLVLVAALGPARGPAGRGLDAGAALLLAAFVVNLVLLVTGRKTEWSFAMFSNVRPYGPARVAGVRPPWTQRYYAVRWRGAIPSSVREAVPGHVERSLRTGDSLVTGPVAEELRARAGAGVEIVPVRFDRGRRVFVDDPGAAVRPRGGPLWVAPVMPRDPGARYLG
jgi:hypothetical protein